MSDSNDITRGTTNRGVTDRGVGNVAQRWSAAERGLALPETQIAPPMHTMHKIAEGRPGSGRLASPGTEGPKAAKAAKEAEAIRDELVPFLHEIKDTDGLRFGTFDRPPPRIIIHDRDDTFLAALKKDGEEKRLVAVKALCVAACDKIWNILKNAGVDLSTLPQQCPQDEEQLQRLPKTKLQKYDVNKRIDEIVGKEITNPEIADAFFNREGKTIHIRLKAWDDLAATEDAAEGKRRRRALVAHEMAHAYAGEGWDWFLMKLGVRDMHLTSGSGRNVGAKEAFAEYIANEFQRNFSSHMILSKETAVEQHYPGNYLASAEQFVSKLADQKELAHQKGKEEAAKAALFEAIFGGWITFDPEFGFESSGKLKVNIPRPLIGKKRVPWPLKMP